MHEELRNALREVIGDEELARLRHGVQFGKISWICICERGEPMHVKHDIRRTIADYMRDKEKPSSHDLQCFIGMIESGEALFSDFQFVGGDSLMAEVQSAVDKAWGRK